MDQQKLWHDCLSDSLHDAVTSLGGPKEVAFMLWPSKDISRSHILLLHSLDAERAEKLSLDEIEMVITKAAERGCHTPMAYLSRACGYKEPETIDPETEAERLRRDMQLTMVQLNSQMKAVQHQLDRMPDTALKAVS